MAFGLVVPVLMSEAEQERGGRLVDFQAGDGIVEHGRDLPGVQVEAATSDLKDLLRTRSVERLLHRGVQRLSSARVY